MGPSVAWFYEGQLRPTETGTGPTNGACCAWHTDGEHQRETAVMLCGVTCVAVWTDLRISQPPIGTLAFWGL